MTNDGYFESTQEMQEALDKGYEVTNDRGDIVVIIKGKIGYFHNHGVAHFTSVDGLPKTCQWKIKLPDLTKPFASMLEYKGWERLDNGEWVECFLFTSDGVGTIEVWDEQECPRYNNFNIAMTHPLIIEDFSWTDPRPKKRKVTLELTDEQIESLRKQGVEVTK